MGTDWRRLAARLNAAQRAEGPPQDEGARAARREAERVARRALMADILAFGRQVGGIDVEESEDLVVWRTPLREVRFDASDVSGVVRVSWREPVPRTGLLYREPLLHDRWVLSIGRPPTEDRLPWMDAGILRLVVQGLGLAPPLAEEDLLEEAATSDASPAPAAADLPPTSAEDVPSPRRSL